MLPCYHICLVNKPKGNRLKMKSFRPLKTWCLIRLENGNKNIVQGSTDVGLVAIYVHTNTTD
jgi:hypothetical protein